MIYPRSNRAHLLGRAETLPAVWLPAWVYQGRAPGELGGVAGGSKRGAQGEWSSPGSWLPPARGVRLPSRGVRLPRGGVALPSRGVQGSALPAGERHSDGGGGAGEPPSPAGGADSSPAGSGELAPLLLPGALPRAPQGAVGELLGSWGALGSAGEWLGSGRGSGGPLAELSGHGFTCWARTPTPATERRPTTPIFF